MQRDAYADPAHLWIATGRTAFGQMEGLSSVIDETKIFGCMCMIRTNWIVITGAPCAGKTTLLNQIREQYGYRYIPEIARTYIEAKLQRGCTLQEIRGDEGVFQQTLITAKLEIERELPVADLIFMDRALPDSLSYYRLAGIPVDTIAKFMKERVYARVFLLERVPMESDHARVESENQRELVERFLFEDYSALGYDVIRVPVMPLAERVSFLFKRMHECLGHLLPRAAG